MKPGDEATPAVPDRARRRRVRLFVALHLGVAGLIYAVALVIGGGFAGPTMPLVTHALTPESAKQLTNSAAPSRAVTEPVAAPSTYTGLPVWTQRAEIPAPWESR